MLQGYEGWLENARKAVANGQYDANLPDGIKTIEKGVARLQEEKAQFELELAATDPNKAN